MPQIILEEGDMGHCSICPMVFSPKCLVTCQLCGQILENADQVSHHLELAHPPDSCTEIDHQRQDQFKCVICLNWFFSGPLLEEHVIVAHLRNATVKIKNSQCYCNYCGKDFRNVQILSKHELKCVAQTKIVPEIKLGAWIEESTLAEDVVMTCNKDEETEEDSVNQDDFHYNDEDDDPMEDFVEMDLEKQEEPKSIVEEAIRKLENTSVTFEMISLPKKEVQLEDITARPTVQDPEIELYSNCCPHCPRKFKSDIKAHDHIVKEHYEQQLNELQVCQECEYEALDENFMFKHFSAKHIKKMVRYHNLICKLCSLFFEEESDLTNHKDEKHKGLAHESRRKSSIKDIYANTVDPVTKRAFCKMCETSVSKTSDLRRHYLNRHPEALDARDCPCCEITPIDDSSMFRHMKQRHKKEMKNKKIVECICFPCNLMFKTAEDLKVHKTQKHEEQKQKRFTSVDIFADSVDPKTQRATCKLCNSTVRKASDLRRHFLSFHPETLDARKCIFCDITPIDDKSMFKHIRLRHHKDMEKEEAKELICKPCRMMYKTKEEKQRHHEEIHKSQQLTIKDIYADAVDPVTKKAFCKLCTSSVSKPSDLSRHYIGCHPEVLDLRKCPYCKITPIDNGSMFRHMKLRHRIEMENDEILKLICRQCSMMFKTEKECSEHIESHEAVDHNQLNEPKEEDNSQESINENHDILDFSTNTCKLCKKSFGKSSDMKRHMINIHPKVVKIFPCAQCDTHCLSSAKLENHCFLKHEEKGRGFVKGKTCTSCNKTFVSHEQALRHAQCHWQTFTCEFCGKIYHHKRSFDNHVKFRHGKIEILQCEHCNYRGKKMNLERHIALKHTVQTPSICDICGKIFTCEALMKKHSAVVHGEILNCKFCDFKMYRKQLNAHMRVKHRLGVRKDCHICDFNTTDNKTFLEHLEKEHSLVAQILDVNYRKCRFCPKVINKAFAKEHTLKFHKQTEVVCETCGKMFVSVPRKNRHYRTVHLDIPRNDKRRSKKPKAETDKVGELI